MSNVDTVLAVCYNPSMSKKNVVVIGFMGSGKSMVSKELENLLGMPIVATDAEIVAREGCEVNELFRDKGESYFREVERDVIRLTAQRDGVIIDCGGGVVLDPVNIQNLKTTGVVFYLSASPEYIYNQIKGMTHRPLLNVPDPLGRIRELMDQRRPLYQAQADVMIDANRSVREIAEDIAERFRKSGNTEDVPDA